MKKLSLNLDRLTVESFETHAPRDERGTVFGAQSDEQCSEGSCQQTNCCINNTDPGPTYNCSGALMCP